MDDEAEVCSGCGLRRRRVDGSADPYGGASPSCWAAFNELCAIDYAAWKPMRHRLTVDAYMAQHPGFATAGGRRSVLVHLVGLELVLVRGLSGPEVGGVMAQVFPDKSKDDVPVLHPVPILSTLDVDHVLCAPPEDQDARVTSWAMAVHRAWTPHHGVVHALLEAALARAARRRRPSGPR